ncbi:MAG: hypothetical protein R6U21_01835 [Thermoplasmatota archaeon]
MQITKPFELVGKEIYDKQGLIIGRVDKYWSSWNKNNPGWFFGIRPYENVRDTWFRGTEKLIPIASSYIKDVGEVIYLDTIIDELSSYWKDVVNIKGYSWPLDWLMEQGIYDKTGSRIGTLFGWVKSENAYQYYGCLIDPYLSEVKKYAAQSVFPIKPGFIDHFSDSVRLNVSLDELKKYWNKQGTSSAKKKTTKKKTRTTKKKPVSAKSKSKKKKKKVSKQ